MDCVKDLPVDVLSKIDSYKIGDPKYLKAKYSEELKRIQHKYKISRLGLKKTKTFEIKKYIYIIAYCIMREGVPFSLKGI